MTRKVRTDKKKSINPTVSCELRDCVYQLAFIVDEPIKNVIETLLINGSRRKNSMNRLSAYFIRDVRIGNTVYMGDNERANFNTRSNPGSTMRISTRVSQEFYRDLEGIAYAMGCSVSKACALLLDATLKDAEFLNEFVGEYIKNNITPDRLEALKWIMKDLNASNPHGEKVSWTALLSYLVDEVKVGAEKLQDTVTEFVVHRWDK
ncbi:hypothetical protein HMPREF9372_3333 [Sporosarcina newyorkensis 2681]|uniref:Uncharacterized protein n=1 Tax=Sporosarcina newyorkensis 2681 TaxID=1027292 RepID=F9DX02_9BACL|nr:hypothetical protein [Sporosarcina newyorkensis]EGQ21296.1 hypothetical protein HMPREF9372_3333 [Sporosarcina newyorkensis 2681]